MGFIRTLLAVVLLASSALDGQDVVPPARTILDLSNSEQIAFIRSTMELGFPANRADQMTMLIINRSALTLPLIEAKLEKALKSTPPPKSFVETASEMIAYAGDEQALRVISKLVALDENRFGRLVGATFAPLHDQVNTVAYRANLTGYRWARTRWNMRFYEVTAAK